MKPVVAITMGDPGGIGPEIILKSIHKKHFKNSRLLLIGSTDVFKTQAKRARLPFNQNHFPILESIPNVGMDFKFPVSFLDVTAQAKALYKKRFDVKRGDYQVQVGAVAAWNGCLALTALEVAANLAHRKCVKGIVTAPIHKEAVRLFVPRFRGHTDYLAEYEQVNRYAMMFVSQRLRVTLATIHLPLKKVSRVLTANKILSKIELTHDFLSHYFRIKSPKLAVCALNPHGREFGSEEDRVILPAVKAAQKKGICVTGPVPGDQVFFEAFHGGFDAVIAMYHDQGLAPFKMIAFRDGVNVTLGLPYLRTSPDHGTAFDIAYQNKAFPNALENSIKLIDQSFS